jgi:hypothetical protein
MRAAFRAGAKHAIRTIAASRTGAKAKVAAYSTGAFRGIGQKKQVSWKLQSGAYEPAVVSRNPCTLQNSYEVS